MASTAKTATSTVSAERAARLFRLVEALRTGPQTRAALLKKLKLEVRGFYRDLLFLREVDIQVELSRGKYHLIGDADLAIEKLPFPDPGLNLGEAHLLAKGRSKAHKRLRDLLNQIEK